MDAGLPKSDGEADGVEFRHENFRKAQPHLLGLIRRKVMLRQNSDISTALNILFNNLVCISDVME